MPYSITERDNQFCVVKTDTGEELKCYASKQDALDYLGALEANVDDADKTYVDMKCYPGGAIKAVGNGMIEGHLIVFTDPTRKDLTGQFFDQETERYEEDCPLEDARVMFHHGLNDAIGIRRIGRITKATVDDVGVFVQGVLNERDEYEKAIYDLAKKGKLGWSSGALPQTVKVARNGHIEAWGVIDASLTPTPAMPYDTQIYMVKSLPVLNLRGLIAGEDSSAAVDDKTNVSEQVQPEFKGLKTMDVDKIKQLIAAFAEQLLSMLGGDAAPPPPPPEEVKAAADEAAAEIEEEKKEAGDEAGKSVSVEKMEAIIEKYATALVEKALERNANKNLRAQKAAEAMKAKLDKGVSRVGGYSDPNRENPSQRIDVSESLKYAHLSATDMAMAYKLSIAATPLGPQGIAGRKPTDFVSEDFYRHAVNKAYAFHDKKPLIRSDEELSLKSARPFKANEMDASNITGQGVEYLGYFYDSVVWETARNTRIYELMQSRGMIEKEVPQGAKSTYVPVEGNDPTVYGGGEANSTDSTGRPEAVYKITPITTIQQTVTPGVFRAATADTLILQEDSIVDIAAESNRKLTLAMLENIEKAFINADSETAANTNINSIDGTPTSTGMTADYYLQFNGLLKSPLVTSTTYKRDAGGTISLNDYLSTLTLLPPEQAAHPERLFYVIDFYTRQASLKFPELKTRDVAADAATVFTGTLPSLWDIPVYMSGFMGKANTAGKVATTTPANNTTGRILLVYAPYWAFSYKRNLTIETQRFPESESTAFYASMRFSLTRRSASASAVSYNVGI